MAMSKLTLKEGINFVEPLSEELNCPICFGLLQDPFLSACCGNHFCEPCANKVKQNNNKCPLCQDTPLNGIVNKGLKRKVNELKVYCSHKQTGCSWVGDLGKLEGHIAADKTDGECQFITVKCPVSTQCGAKFLRKSLEDHVKNVCGYRQFTCKYCGYQSTYVTITSGHYSKCHQYPVPCPNNCSAKAHPRSLISNHLALCPEQEVACDFSEMGCKEKMKRRLLQAHMETNITKHLLNVSQAYKVQDKTIKQLEKQVTDLSQKVSKSSTSCWPVEFKLTVNKERKLNWPLYLSKMTAISLVYPVTPLVLEVPLTVTIGTICKCGLNGTMLIAQPYSSAPFYSHPDGYKLRLSAKLVNNCPKCVMQYVQSSILPSNYKLDTSLLVNIQLIDGEHDHELKWPFKKQIDVTLLNKVADNCHHKIGVSCEGNRRETLRLEKTADNLLQPLVQLDEEIVGDSKLLKRQYDEFCQASSVFSPVHLDQKKMHFNLYHKFYELIEPNSFLFPFEDKEIREISAVPSNSIAVRRMARRGFEKTLKLYFEVAVCYL